MVYRRLISSNNPLQVTAALAIQTAVKSINNSHKVGVMRVYRVLESYQLHFWVSWTSQVFWYLFITNYFLIIWSHLQNALYYEFLWIIRTFENCLRIAKRRNILYFSSSPSFKIRSLNIIINKIFSNAKC